MVRILIVDDQKLVREGIKILLEKRTEIEIVGDASDGESAFKKIEALEPDIVLLDINMPGIDGLTVADKIRFKFPQVKIIMLSSHEGDDYVRKATELGAKGYLLKNASSQELEWSIKLVNQGYSAIRSELLEKQITSNLKPEADLKLDLDSQSNNASNNLPNSELSSQKSPNLDQVELLLAKNHVKQKYSNFKKTQKQHTALFHRVNMSKARRTIMSFEFKLLVLAILFCLGFLVFIALS